MRIAPASIHRDIKPENILLHEGEPVIADFGIATARSAAAGDDVYVTERGIAVGTPGVHEPRTGERGVRGRWTHAISTASPASSTRC